MKKFEKIFILFLVISLAVYGQEKNSSKVKKLMPRPPIYGIPAKTLPKGHFIYRSYFIYSPYAEMFSSQQNSMIDLPKSMNFNSYAYISKIRYGLTNRITLIMNIPLIYKKLQNNNVEKKGLGIGDIQAAMLYKFYQNKEKKFLISGLLYSKLPTGKFYNLASNELPLGTGSYDIGLACMPEKELGKFDMRLSAFYIYRSKNKANIELGDVQMVSFSTAYNWSKNFITEGTIYFKNSFDNKKDGQIITNTNTQLSQLVLGAQYRVMRTFLIQLAVPVTLYAKMPFSTDYNLWLGFYFLM